MEDVDTHEFSQYDDETVFLSDVIQEEHELLFLDSYLREAFRGRSLHGPGRGAAVAAEVFGAGGTI